MGHRLVSRIEFSAQLLRVALAITLPLSPLGLSACSTLQRSAESGYADDRNSASGSPAPLEYQRERQSYLDQQALSEMGLPANTPIDDQVASLIDTHLELARLERNIETQREKRQYYALKGFMRDDSERIQFLQLPDTQAREVWAHQRGIDQREDQLTTQAAPLIERKDIAIGMTQKAVTQSWGDPESVEVSGDPVYGNELWRYMHFAENPEGYSKQQRIVYFKLGRVVGWETY
jgi:hypothetical protein